VIDLEVKVKRAMRLAAANTGVCVCARARARARAAHGTHKDACGVCDHSIITHPEKKISPKNE